MSARLVWAAVLLNGTVEALQQLPLPELMATSGFDEYITTFSRAYRRGSPEYAMRSELFQQRDAWAQAHNSRSTRLWKAGHNAFSDRTRVELAQLRGWRAKGPAGSFEALALHRAVPARHSTPALAEEVSWLNLSTVSVRDQGQCGSCWAVATASMLEARYEVQAKTPRSFSAQQLVNCVPNPDECGGSGGCDGATVELALTYMQKHGLADSIDVPYIGADQACVDSAMPSLRQTGGSLALSSWETLKSNKAQPLMEALMDGPVAVSASAEDWFMYINGIFDGCDPDAVVDHAILMTGYGGEAGKKFWTIQNSWGSGWGEKGYIRLLRHDTPKEDDEFCGTDWRPEEGMACKPYPDSVEVCGMCGVLFDSVIADFASVDAAAAKAAKSPKVSKDSESASIFLGTAI